MSVREEIKDVKVFISYSWKNPEIVEWVREELATRLLSDGIDVVLDQWDLKEGHDIYQFMESIVNDSTIDKVLVICDEGYEQKANEREGGVGTETRIITPKIYQEANQEKFIPIIAERDEEGNSFIPTYMVSRKYIDLSSDDLFIENYEHLLRTLYQRPSNRKPKRGSAPAFLFEEETLNNFKFNFLLKQMSVDLNKGRIEAAKVKSTEIKNEFIDSMKEFEVQKGESPELTAQVVEEEIDNILVLRDGYIELIEKLVENDIISEDFCISFLEGIYNEFIEIKSKVNGSYYQFQFDNFKFFIKEVFIYTIAILIRYEKYQLISEILYSRFFVHKDYSSNDKEGVGFCLFNFYISALDDIQVKKSGSNYHSYSSEKMKRRSTKSYDINFLANTEILLYYLSSIENEERAWFPHTYIYSKKKIELIQKLESTRHFEKVKVIFNVTNKEELISLINRFENKYRDGYRRVFSSGIPDLKEQIDVSKICRYR